MTDIVDTSRKNATTSPHNDRRQTVPGISSINCVTHELIIIFTWAQLWGSAERMWPLCEPTDDVIGRTIVKPTHNEFYIVTL